MEIVAKSTYAKLSKSRTLTNKAKFERKKKRNDLIHPTWPLNKNRLKIQKRNYEFESYDQIEFIIKNMDA